ncbi:hypothetical protein [Tomitella cavernea]|uniref:Uncharacterized protein n=1 Tax=Tomitella cavernea TaxID=1387982 RepID=A0ABP9D304_9ACTN|nr:hypothetical protein [Tomitella cavernea]
MEFLALLGLGLLLVWAVGGALARVGGGLLVIEELGRMVIDGVTTRTLWLLAAGWGCGCSGTGTMQPSTACGGPASV